MARLSDSELAFRLQMEEALSASLSSRSSTAPPPPSPVVHRCGVMIVLNDDQSSSARRAEPADVHAGDRGGDLGKPSNGGGRNEKPHGKGNMYDKATGVRGDERKTTGKSSICGNSAVYSNNGKPSPVIRPQEFVHQVKSPGEGCSKSKFKDNVLYRLYFKGLVSEETGDGKNTATSGGFGVAICDQADNAWFEMKGPLFNTGSSRQGAEIMALMRGLEEAVGLGIKYIAIHCDYYPIYQYLSGRWVPKQKKIGLLMDDLQRLRQQLTFSKPVLVTRNDIKFAFKLAREAIVCQISSPAGARRVKAARKETCVICLDDTDAELMFSVDKCLHRYCFSCVHQYVEVKLLRGIIPKCPHDGCKSMLSIDSCAKLLTPKLIEMWKKRIKEDSIPVTEKVYCPYPRCSALMSKTELSRSAESLSVHRNSSGVRRCVECRGLFCINCKVPWHSSLSCTDYKKLHPGPPADDVKLKSLANVNKWRQCVKCHHMIELSQGCYHMTCRCGYEFCYNCGAEWNKKKKRCPSSCPLWNENYLMRGNAANYADFDDDDDDYYDDDDDDYDDDYAYDYDVNDYLGLGPHIDDDEFPFDNPARWFELGYPVDDPAGAAAAPHPIYHIEDESSDEEDWDSHHEEEHSGRTTNSSGTTTANSSGTTTVDAPANVGDQYNEDWDYEHEEEVCPGHTTAHAPATGEFDFGYDHHDPWECGCDSDNYDDFTGIEDDFGDVGMDPFDSDNDWW